MLHARDDYNRIQDPENKIPADEPVFLLRAQDRTAALVVRMWAALQPPSSPLKTLALLQADKMDKWLPKKIADLDSEDFTPPFSAKDDQALLGQAKLLRNEAIRFADLTVKEIRASLAIMNDLRARGAITEMEWLRWKEETVDHMRWLAQRTGTGVLQP